MIVDDDVELLAGMQALVASWGCKPLAFSKFEEARGSLLGGLCPDALLVDVRIGAFNGLHLVHIARQLYPTMNIVAMTGFDDPVLRSEAEKAGAAFLLKPVSAADLQKTLVPTT